MAQLIIYDDHRDRICKLLQNDAVDELLTEKSTNIIYIYNKSYADMVNNIITSNFFYYCKYHPDEISLTENECKLLGIEYPACITRNYYSYGRIQ